MPDERDRARDFGTKLLIGSGIGLVVGFGTCSVGAFTISTRGSAATNILIGGGAMLFFTSAIVMVVTAAALIVRLVARR